MKPSGEPIARGELVHRSPLIFIDPVPARQRCFWLPGARSLSFFLLLPPPDMHTYVPDYIDARQRRHRKTMQRSRVTLATHFVHTCIYIHTYARRVIFLRAAAVNYDICLDGSRAGWKRSAISHAKNSPSWFSARTRYNAKDTIETKLVLLRTYFPPVPFVD